MLCSVVKHAGSGRAGSGRARKKCRGKRETQRMRGEIIEFLIIKQIKKPRLVLCSVVKQLGSGRALKKWGNTLDCVSRFPVHFFRAPPLPA